MNTPLWDIPPRRGHIVLVELDPVVDPEQNKIRPCIIVSNDGANAAATQTGNTMLTVIPLTRTLNTTRRDRPYQTVITPEESGLSAISTAQAEQVRSVSVRRITRIVGHLNYEAMARVNDALKIHLALDT